MRFFLKNQVIVSRLKTTTGNLKEYQTTGTAEAHIQRRTDLRSEIQGGVFGRQFNIWCQMGVDIKEGDRLVDENGVNYDVKEVYESTFGASDYLEVVVEKTEGYND